MARKLNPEEEHRFLEALEQFAQSGGDDSLMSPACLRRKEDAPLPVSTELAAWLIEQHWDRFPF
jgi:hypothetical protein